MDEYVNGGDGSAEEAVGEIGFAIYRTQEMAELADWMRSYNETVPAEEALTSTASWTTLKEWPRYNDISSSNWDRKRGWMMKPSYRRSGKGSACLWKRRKPAWKNMENSLSDP